MCLIFGQIHQCIQKYEKDARKPSRNPESHTHDDIHFFEKQHSHTITGGFHIFLKGFTAPTITYHETYYDRNR